MRDVPASLSYAPVPKRSVELRNWLIAAGLLLAWGVRLATQQPFGFSKFNFLTKAALFLPLLALLPPVARVAAKYIGVLRAMGRRSRWRMPLIIAALSLA